MKHLVKDFAQEELVRYQLKANDNKNIHLILNLAMNEDHYRLNISPSKNVIEAGNERGLLYGVYTYAQKYLGFQFMINNEVLGNQKDQSMSELFQPRFDRRGNIFEVINDTDYLLSQIDLNTKLGHNEIFFTFFLYDEVKSTIYESLKKRGYKVTLGGHSLKWLLEPILDLAKDEKENLSFYKDEKLMDYVIERIVQICKEDELVSRISLWPQDIGIPESRGQEFMQLYINFNSNLKAKLKEAGLKVDVEFIVYNAGLNWEMLDYYENIKVDSELEILYAYWGRDYSKPLEVKRAVQALQSWLNISKVCVLEYYSDFFMLSELYPPLNHRIGVDASEYESMGVSGLLNLVVPLLSSRTSEKYSDKYDYKLYHQSNNFIYSVNTWESTSFKQSPLEEKLAAITRYNRDLFPKRLVDVELSEEMINELKDISALLNVEDVNQSMIQDVINEMLYE